MGEVKQNQRAGDNSVQTQIDTQIVLGIDEKRVREIFDEKIAIAIADYSCEGRGIGRQRIDVLAEKVVKQLKKTPALIQSFADPAVQRNIIQAQISAAESNRESDLDTLSELLLARMRGDLKRSTKTGIRRAIEIVPELEDNELVALSVLLLNSRFVQRNAYASHIDSFLSALNDTLKQVVKPIGLPHGTRWLQHLSILDCVEVNHTRSFKKLEDWYSEIYTGMVCAGIKIDTAVFYAAQKALNECGIGADMLVQNDLLPGYVRLPISRLGDLSVLPVQIPNMPSLHTMMPNDKHQHGLKAVIELYSNDPHLMQSAKKVFAERILHYETLKEVRVWLEEFKHRSFIMTNIGEALAYVYARHSIPDLPEIAFD